MQAQQSNTKPCAGEGLCILGYLLHDKKTCLLIAVNDIRLLRQPVQPLASAGHWRPAQMSIMIDVHGNVMYMHEEHRTIWFTNALFRKTTLEAELRHRLLKHLQQQAKDSATRRLQHAGEGLCVPMFVNICQKTDLDIKNPSMHRYTKARRRRALRFRCVAHMTTKQ